MQGGGKLTQAPHCSIARPGCPDVCFGTKYNRNTQHTELKTWEGQICLPARCHCHYPALRDSAGSMPRSYSPKPRKLPLGVKEGRISVPAPPDTKDECFPFSLPEYPSRQRGKTLCLYPLQHCQNMHQIPIYSRRRGLGAHAKPQPSAMLNQSDFALTWPLSPAPARPVPQTSKESLHTGAFVAVPHNHTSHPMAC